MQQQLAESRRAQQERFRQQQLEQEQLKLQQLLQQQQLERQRQQQQQQQRTSNQSSSNTSHHHPNAVQRLNNQQQRQRNPFSRERSANGDLPSAEERTISYVATVLLNNNRAMHCSDRSVATTSALVNLLAMLPPDQRQKYEDLLRAQQDTDQPPRQPHQPEQSFRSFSGQGRRLGYIAALSIPTTTFVFAVDAH
jgi:hypothetical protein